MGSRKRLLCLSAEGALIVTLALLAPGLASAGETNYSTNTQTGQTIIPGTVDSGSETTYSTNTQTGQTIIPGTVDSGNHCDDCTTQVTFPFEVPIYDQPFTSAWVSSNGNIQFDDRQRRLVDRLSVLADQRP